MAIEEIEMAGKYRFSKKLLEEQGFEIREGERIELKLANDLVIRAKIIEVGDVEVIAVGTDI